MLLKDAEIEIVRDTGRIASLILDRVSDTIKPGISTQEIDDLVVELAEKHGMKNAPLNYKGFPKSCCTSVNDVICHGIPNPNHILKDGDIINVDITLIGPRGLHADTSRMFRVGEVSQEASDLIDCAKAALDAGIAAVKEGACLSDIGNAIGEIASHYGIVQDFVGHGIGYRFHEHPQVKHYPNTMKMPLKPGMMFTIEPMLNEGRKEHKMLADGWTAKTIDRKLSAQWEHTIAIKSNWEVVIITQ